MRRKLQGLEPDPETIKYLEDIKLHAEEVERKTLEALQNGIITQEALDRPGGLTSAESARVFPLTENDMESEKYKQAEVKKLADIQGKLSEYLDQNSIGVVVGELQQITSQLDGVVRQIKDHKIVKENYDHVGDEFVLRKEADQLRYNPDGKSRKVQILNGLQLLRDFDHSNTYGYFNTFGEGSVDVQSKKGYLARPKDEYAEAYFALKHLNEKGRLHSEIQDWNITGVIKAGTDDPEESLRGIRETQEEGRARDAVRTDPFFNDLENQMKEEKPGEEK